MLAAKSGKSPMKIKDSSFQKLNRTFTLNPFFFFDNFTVTTKKGYSELYPHCTVLSYDFCLQKAKLKQLN